jgi:hypothetical protein
MPHVLLAGERKLERATRRRAFSSALLNVKINCGTLTGNMRREHAPMFQPEHWSWDESQNDKWLILLGRVLAQLWMQRVSGRGNVYFRGKPMSTKVGIGAAECTFKSTWI